MNNPIISIIVPVYKVEQYIRQCLDSILASTFTDFELLLVDDGSPDQSGVICDEYALKDSRIKVFHKPNGGVSSARNLGLDNAQGEWVTFIDSDDLIAPTFLEGLYKPIAKGENVDFVQGGCTNYEKDYPTTINHQFDYCVCDLPRIVFEKMEGLTFSKLFRTEIINISETRQLRFDEHMKLCEDMDFTYRYLMISKCSAFVPEVGYLYRRDNQGSALHTLVRDYEYGIENYHKLVETYQNAIKSVNLSFSDLPNNSRHKAHHLVALIWRLYKNNYSRKERLFHLQNDIISVDYTLLMYYKSNGLKELSVFFLRHKWFRVFDIYTNLIVKLWKITK